MITDPTVGSLKLEKHHFNAPDGGKGGTNGRAGKDGKDVFVKVPVGVVVRRILDWDEMDLFDEENDDVEGGVALFGDDLEDVDSENLSLCEFDEDDNDETQDISNDLDIVTSDESFEDEHEIEDETEMGDEFEDFDTYYQNLQSSRKIRAGGERKDGLPTDYDEVVNKELRADDGMYYWTSPETPETLDDISDHLRSNEQMDRKSVFVADLDKPNTSLLIARGGKNGVGNQAFANRQHTPHLNSHAAAKSQPGEGEITHFELELKLIADVGLVGFPNAGKSSLLSAMSRAKPKIASYPFTTLHPLVGTIHYKDGFKIVLADVPGLIDGAAEGRGRGVEFLRHIERTKALVYIVDAASVDGRDPIDDLRILGKELKEYGSSGYFDENIISIDDEIYDSFEEEMKRRRREIMKRPSLILANKMDLIPQNDAGLGRREELLFQLAAVAEEVGIECEQENILGISAGVSGEGLQVLSKRLRNVLSG